MAAVACSHACVFHPSDCGGLCTRSASPRRRFATPAAARQHWQPLKTEFPCISSWDVGHVGKNKKIKNQKVEKKQGNVDASLFPPVDCCPQTVVGCARSAAPRWLFATLTGARRQRRLHETGCLRRPMGLAGRPLKSQRQMLRREPSR